MLNITDWDSKLKPFVSNFTQRMAKITGWKYQMVRMWTNWNSQTQIRVAIVIPTLEDSLTVS